MNPLTPSLFLFEKPATDIFEKKFSSDFANASLKVMMKVITYLLSEKEAFFLLAPNAANNQCHVYSTRMALIQRKYRQMSEEKKQAYTQTNRFLFLSFFLSFHFDPRKKSSICDVIKKVRKEFSIELPRSAKKFYQFAKDSEECRTRASRDALIQVSRDYLRKDLKSKCDLPLYRELYLISSHDLKLKLKRKCGIHYTFPKFAGVVYIVDLIYKHAIATMLRVKVITKHGTEEMCYVSFDPKNGMVPKEEVDEGSINKKEPIIVFEGLVTDGSLSYQDALALGKKCPRSFRHLGGEKNLHKLEENCSFCLKGNSLSLESFKNELKNVILSTQAILYPQGKDFMIHHQSSFLHYFNDPSFTPLLTTRFKETHELTGFEMVTVYSDTIEQALNNEMQLNRSPRQQLEERGLL